MLIGAYSIYILMLYTFALPLDTNIMIGAFALFFSAKLIVTPSLTNMVASITPVDKRGRVNVLRGLSSDIARSIGAVAGGYLKEINSSYPFYGYMICLGLSIMILLKGYRTKYEYNAEH